MMGVNGQSNEAIPRRRFVPARGFVYELMLFGHGLTAGGGPDKHCATQVTEHVTAAEWASLTLAATQGTAALDTAFGTTSAAPAWARAKAKCAAAGMVWATHLASLTARYAALHGASLSSVWVTG